MAGLIYLGGIATCAAIMYGVHVFVKWDADRRGH